MVQTTLSFKANDKNNREEASTQPRGLALGSSHLRSQARRPVGVGLAMGLDEVGGVLTGV